MSNSGNKTDDQISCECPIVEALGMVSLEEPSSTTGETMEEEIFPIPMESEVANITNSACSVDKTLEGASNRPITPNPDVLAPSYLKESFEIFKQRYPPLSFFVGHGPPVFAEGEPFLFLKLNSEMIGLNRSIGKLSLENSLCLLGYGRNKLTWMLS